MFMSELNVQENAEHGTVLAPDGYWHNDCERFKPDELSSMASWLNNQQTGNNPIRQIPVPSKIIDTSSFSESRAWHTT